MPKNKPTAGPMRTQPMKALFACCLISFYLGPVLSRGYCSRRKSQRSQPEGY
jgi:hypothetical protein